MKTRVTVLDSRQHAGFLRQQRRDPVTHEPFRPGDRVVMCAGGCGSAFFESSWRLIGGLHCGQSGTLKVVDVDDTGKRFWKRPARQQAQPDSPVGAEAPAADVGRQDTQAPTSPRTTGLREIPLSLREVPVSLRKVVGLREI